MRNMKSDVYYFTARTYNHEESLSKVKGPLALEKIGFNSKVNEGDKVVIKTHFGALENVRYLRPSYIRFLCDHVKTLGGVPYVAESCGWGAPEEVTGIHTEYSGRSSEDEYLETAKKHGFTKETMGAELLMLDGSVGINNIKHNFNGKRFKDVLVAGRLKEFDHMILATHFKGHAGGGFGGSLKNLGIGCVSKGGKVQAHMGKKFEFDFNAPISDYEACLKICPTNALRESSDGKILRDEDKCRYCYMCKSVCKNNVIDTGSSTQEEFTTQMIDNAAGVVDYFGKNKIYYLNYVIDVTWQCDCTGGSDVPFVSDIGILSSLDPVAVDQSAVDLIHLSLMNPHSILGDIKSISKEEPNEWFSYTPRFDPETHEMDLNPNGKESKHWEVQLVAAEDIGLGSRDYNLIEVNIESKKKN
ncbi:MAG: DUF362 domain-containing protein [Candidatus Lokiarchaeota archaeon]|nr:DUF362 domain-containing protein [Candidatus Lokiarchaeota archaeon]